MRLFRYDPFAHRPREQATVGALRAEAAGVDTSLRGSGKAPRDPSEGPITILDIVNAASANGATASPVRAGRNPAQPRSSSAEVGTPSPLVTRRDLGARRPGRSTCRGSGARLRR